MKPKLNKMAYFSFFVAVFCLSVAFLSKNDYTITINVFLTILNSACVGVHFVNWRQKLELYNLTHSKDIDDK